LARFHTHNFKTRCLQAVSQILGERARFQADTFNIKFKIIQIGDDVLNIRGQLGFGNKLALVTQ